MCMHMPDAFSNPMHHLQTFGKHATRKRKKRKKSPLKMGTDSSTEGFYPSTKKIIYRQLYP